MNLNELIKQVHQNAKDHGWWDESRTIAELLCLVHSEVSEALEEDRNHHEPNETYYSHTDKHQGTIGKSMSDMETKNDIIIPCVYSTTVATLKPFVADDRTIDKPEGIPSELADIVIRVMDICGYYGIDLEAAITEKMEYNRNRPIRHGGKKL
jgi:hypothetical protein